MLRVKLSWGFDEHGIWLMGFGFWILLCVCLGTEVLVHIMVSKGTLYLFVHDDDEFSGDLRCLCSKYYI